MNAGEGDDADDWKETFRSPLGKGLARYQRHTAYLCICFEISTVSWTNSRLLTKLSASNYQHLHTMGREMTRPLESPANKSRDLPAASLVSSSCFWRLVPSASVSTHNADTLAALKYSMSLIANYTPTYCALGHCMPVLSLHGRLNHDTQIVIAANAGGITNLSRTEAGAIPHTTLCRRKHWTSPPHLRILQQP